jgi:TPR repeat protein
MYHGGHGRDKDYAAARGWYERAAAQGHVEAFFNLGVLYSEGQGVRRDTLQSLEWFEKAAQLGHAQAQHNLGVLHEAGWLPQIDLAKAKHWYKMAADQGHVEARDKLVELESRSAANSSISTSLSNLPQTHLTTLASMVPSVLEIVRVPHPSQTIFIEDVGESDVQLVRSLSEEQFKELLEVQDVFRVAQIEGDAARKLKLYQGIVDRAPWHPYATKSLGVCHYMGGNRKKAHEYLKKAAQLAPDDANILQNLRRVESEI